MKGHSKVIILAVCAMLTMTACKNKKKEEVKDKPAAGLSDKDGVDKVFTGILRRAASDMQKKKDPAASENDEKKQQASSADRERRMEIPAPIKGMREQLLKREGYRVSYNTDRKVPNWVAWRLTADHTSGNHYRDGQLFVEDKDVPWPRATDGDYVRSSYDRGHLCPSGDNKWSEKAQTQSFLLTNICPQNHDLNVGDWNDLEIQCRYWAKRMGNLYIVTGPVFYNGVKKTIGKHGVAVPDAFFKVVLDDGRKAKAIGFVYPNRGGHQDMDQCVRSVDEIERITGIDFFPMLDDNVEDVVEAASNKRMIDDWQIEKAVKYYSSQYD